MSDPLIYGASSRLPARDWILLGAVAGAGIAGAMLASASLFLATPLALALVYKGAVRQARDSGGSDLYAHPDLQFRARRAVERAAGQLPAGDARTLLARVVTQAVLFFQAHQTSVGAAREDDRMLDDV